MKAFCSSPVQVAMTVTFCPEKEAPPLAAAEPPADAEAPVDAEAPAGAEAALVGAAALGEAPPELQAPNTIEAVASRPRPARDARSCMLSPYLHRPPTATALDPNRPAQAVGPMGPNGAHRARPATPGVHAPADRRRFGSAIVPRENSFVARGQATDRLASSSQRSRGVHQSRDGTSGRGDGSGQNPAVLHDLHGSLYELT
jgi:hypothetical protein